MTKWTVDDSPSVFVRSAKKETVPGASVYFTALSRMLSSTRFRFVASPTTWSMPRLTAFGSYVSPFSSQRAWAMAFTSSKASDSENSAFSIVSMPVSTRFKSSALSMSPSKCRALRLAFSSWPRASEGKSGFFSARACIPKMTLRGVCISWLMLARNAVLVSFDFSAALSSDSSRSFSMMRCVMLFRYLCMNRTNRLPPNKMAAMIVSGSPNRATAM